MRWDWKPCTAGVGAVVVTVHAAAQVAAAQVTAPSPGTAAASTAAASTTGRITGTVTENLQNAPLGGVIVGVVSAPPGQPAGASARSAASGRYTISGVLPGRYVLRAQLIGYAARTDTVQVTAGQTATLNLALRQTSVSLQQVVVVGYGTQRRSDLTGSVASVTPQVERTPIASLEQTLQGTAPGVQVTQASSAPGGSISIRVRGVSSISGNGEPLYVVDGFPIENDPATTGDVTSGFRTNTAPSNPLAALNPNDIAAIEILKDASATSIYGARGANGVVIITTKRGQVGSPRVTLDAYTGSQAVTKRYDLLNAHEFALFANDWATAVGVTKPYATPDTIGTGTDWQRQIFRTAPIYNAQLGVTGGTSGANATRYAISGGTFQQDGVVDGSNFRRLSLRGNIDQTVADRFHVATNVLVSRVNSAQVPTDGTFNANAGAVGAALEYLPVLPVRKADGTYATMGSDFPANLLASGVTSQLLPNPVSQSRDVQDQLADTRLLANAYGEYTLAPGLRARVSVGADNSNRTRDTYYPRSTLTGQLYNGRAQRGQQQITSFLNENTLAYDRTLGDANQISAVAGYTRQVQTYTLQSEANSNFSNDIDGFNNIGAGTQTGGPTIASGRTRWTLVSYLGRVNYTLLNRYLFTATGREDGSSRFGADHRWGFFPSGAVGWRVSDEGFMKRFTAIDQLKLRASYGLAGNPSITPYQSSSRLSATSYSFGGAVAGGYIPGGIGNPNLHWESTKQADAGVDLALWRDRVDLTADYYNKRTDGLLLATNLPSESGFTTALVNAGGIQNRGVELGLTLRPVSATGRPGAFGWTTTFNFAKNQNKVLSLGGPQRLFASQSLVPDNQGTPGTLVQVGQPIGAFYGYKTNGIFRDSAEVAAYTKTTRLASGTITPGQIRLVDVTYGGKLINLNLYRIAGPNPGTNVTRGRYENAWTPTNPDGSEPRLGTTPISIGSDFTDRSIEDGSFFRLRTVTLSHAVPTQWLGRAMRNVNGARVYVTGQNVFTLTHYSGFNPDVSSLGVGNLNRGVDNGAYPLARTVTVGFNLTY